MTSATDPKELTPIILAIDGGGTTTPCLAIDVEGNLRGEGYRGQIKSCQSQR